MQSRRSTLRRQDDIEDEDNEEEDEEEEDVYESEGPYEEPQTLRESYAAQYSRVRRPTWWQTYAFPYLSSKMFTINSYVALYYNWS